MGQERDRLYSDGALQKSVEVERGANVDMQ